MDKGYLEWLKQQVEYFDSSGIHDRLFERLASHEFTPLMSVDINRATDGIKLRDKYWNETGKRILLGYAIDTPCSFLEFLVALAIRMNFIYADPCEDRTADCFWMMLYNLALDEFTDSDYDRFGGDEVVDEMVNIVNNRLFDKCGNNGLFPLANPKQNQRNVEIWYQMNQYLIELMTEEGRL